MRDYHTLCWQALARPLLDCELAHPVRSVKEKHPQRCGLAHFLLPVSERPQY